MCTAPLSLHGVIFAASSYTVHVIYLRCFIDHVMENVCTDETRLHHSDCLLTVKNYRGNERKKNVLTFSNALLSARLLKSSVWSLRCIGLEILLKP